MFNILNKYMFNKFFSHFRGGQEAHSPEAGTGTDGRPAKPDVVGDMIAAANQASDKIDLFAANPEYLEEMATLEREEDRRQRPAEQEKKLMQELMRHSKDMGRQPSMSHTARLATAKAELQRAQAKTDSQKVRALQAEILAMERDRNQAQENYAAGNEKFWDDVGDRRGRSGGAYDQLRAHAELSDEERQVKEQAWEESTTKLKAANPALYRPAKRPQPIKPTWGQKIRSWFSGK